jgi:hypothetical protein
MIYTSYFAFIPKLPEDILLGPEALRSACNYERIAPAENSAVVKLLLSDERISVNDKANPPIIYACRRGRPEIVKLLAADPRCDLNTVDSNGDGVFINACLSNCSEQERATELVSVLMKNPKINVTLIGENTSFVGAVYVAAIRENVSMLKLLMSDARFDISASEQADSWRTLTTPIVGAIEKSKLECAYILLDDPRCDFHKKCGSGLEAVSATYQCIWQGAEYVEFLRRLVSDKRFDINRIDYLYRKRIADYIGKEFGIEVEFEF